MVVGRISVVIQAEKFVPHYNTAIIQTLRDYIPEIPETFISGQWSAKYKIDAATGNITEVRGVRLPSIAVLEKEGNESDDYLGMCVGNEGNKRVKGLMMESIIWIDIWASNPIQRDNFISKVKRAMVLGYSYLKSQGIVYYKYIKQREQGFDMGDRILMNHSHQKMRANRMIIMYRVKARVTFPELTPAEGVISKIVITIEGDNDLEQVMTIGGTDTPYGIEQDIFPDIIDNYEFEEGIYI